MESKQDERGDPKFKTLQFRHPNASDGKEIWQLVKDTGVLDVNSAYCYIMFADLFSETCVVVEADQKIVGFVSAFCKPKQPDTVFIWQIAVDSSMRGYGLASRLLEHVMKAEKCEQVQYLEATISPSNKASKALFEKFSVSNNAAMVESSGYVQSMFPVDQSEHEEEKLYRIGPLRK